MEEEKKRNKNTTTETVNNGYWKDKIYCKSTFQARYRRNIQRYNTKVNQERNGEDINLSKKFCLCP